MKSSVVFSKKKATAEETANVIRKAADKWPEFIARTEIKKITGGLISPGTAANLDSKGMGIPGAFKIGKNIAYPKNNLADWLISRITE